NQLNANGGPGYTVFGKVVAGMDVLETLAKVKTGYSPVLRAEDVPMSPLILKKVEVVADTPAPAKQ
ncbi:MAG: peptidylprolyl isomerase, partial [Aeromonas sp.]